MRNDQKVSMLTLLFRRMILLSLGLEKQKPACKGRFRYWLYDDFGYPVDKPSDHPESSFHRRPDCVTNTFRDQNICDKS
jgi:hypothetical protein